MTSKHVLLLQEFSKIMCDENPMELTDYDPNEYDKEALSILSRFAESGLEFVENDVEALFVASMIVKQTFEFWFGATISLVQSFDYETLAKDLFVTYKRVVT